MGEEIVAKPLGKLKKKAPKKAVPDRNFKVHPEDPRYLTLTLRFDVMDVDEIRTFLQKTHDQWDRAFEVSVACRLLEAFAMNLPVGQFIGTSSVLSPQRVFRVRGVPVAGFWLPVAIAERFRQLKSARPRIRYMQDADAVRLLMVEAVARYIRPCLTPNTEVSQHIAPPSDEVLKLQEELRMAMATIKRLAAKQEAAPAPVQVPVSERFDDGYRDAIKRKDEQLEKLRAVNSELESTNGVLNSILRDFTALAEAKGFGMDLKSLLQKYHHNAQPRPTL